ncbi:MAG: hypothetical protein Q4B60_09055 [Erysipelotrichaceae bacterium]|nr:hypothetical protein [Erysipelotrichaceae bacterium]
MILNETTRKSMFLEGINALLNQKEINRKIDDALDEICDGYPVFTGTTDIETSYVKVLGNLFKLPDIAIDYIYWFLYEDGGEVTFDNGTSIMIKTAEDLYKLLTLEDEDEDNQ